MESQGNSGRAGVTSRYGLAALRPRDGCRAKALSLFGAWCLFLSLFLWIGMALAQSTNYAYDANGRVVAVTQKDGTSVEYTYDALGHVSQISNPISAGQLAIFSFMPTHGATGTQVTLTGQGFSATLANDTVSFNGVAATVLSASSTQLVVSVPAGATTGPISVTVGNKTAATTSSFVIDDGSLPPTITQISPTIAVTGNTVTVTGSHLDPLPGQTTVSTGSAQASLSAVSDTQIQFPIPSDASSGPVTVQTPYGQAISSSTVVVLPTGYAPSSVVSTGVATLDQTSVALTIGAGQLGVMAFSASGNSWVSLQASSITTTASNLNYWIYAPGNVLITNGTVSTTAPSVHLPKLPSTGTYLVIFKPDTASAQLTIGVQSSAVLSMGVATTMATTVPGQSVRAVFNAAAGQTLALNVLGTTTSPASRAIVYTIYNPNGSTYTSGGVSNTGLINVSNLPVGGTYQVIMAPGSGVTGSAQVELVPGETGQIATNGTPTAFAAKASGENIYLSFTANANANLELTLNNVSSPGSAYNSFYVSVYDPVGNELVTFICYSTYPGASCTQHLWNLAGGTYSVVATPNYGGSISFTALIEPDVVGPVLSTGSSTNINLGTGQVERFSFNANVGDTVALQVSGATTTPSGQGVTVLVYRPDAGVISNSTTTYTSLRVVGTQVLNLSNLPIGGTYTVIAAPDYGLPLTAQLSLVAGVTGTLSAGGTAQSYAGHVAGENIYMTFPATAGANLELTLNNISAPGATYNEFAVNVYAPSGTQVLSYTCYSTNPGASCTQSLWNLVAGTYTVIVTPDYGGTISFNALLEPDVNGPLVSTGSAQSLSLNAGQVERLSFSASAGDTVTLQASGVATVPTGQGVKFAVYRPDVGALTTSMVPYSSSLHTASTQSLSLTNLPVSGTYTVVALPDYGLPANAQLSVVSDVAGSPPTYVTPTLPTNGTPQNESTSTVGQNINLTFNANAGDNLELTLSNVSTTAGSGSSVTVSVDNPAGTAIYSTSCAATTGVSCRIPLWNLVAGSYSVVVSPPNNSSTMSFSTMLQPDVVGGALTPNTPTTVTLATGQVERLTFNANVGDTVALQLSGVSTTPTGQPVYVVVYRPDTGAIIWNQYYSALNATSWNVLNLPNLPASGTYTAVMYTPAGIPATAQLMEYTGVTGSVSTNGTAQSFNVQGGGQNAYFTFNANNGDNLELELSNVSIPSAPGYGVAVNVYNPAGVFITSTNCTISTGASCRLPLWNLTAGAYSVVVSPPTNINTTISFTATLQPDVIGPSLTPNTPTNVTLGMGQVERLSFYAGAGDTVALQLSGVNTTPTGQAVYLLIYGPSGWLITPNKSYGVTSTSTSSVLTVSGLPASGNYIAAVYTYQGIPASAQVTWIPVANGSVSTNGSFNNFAAGGAGQNVVFSFNASPGDNLELTLSNVNVIGASTNGFEVNVYDASGNNVENFVCYASNPGASCSQPLWNLAGGTYRVIAIPIWGGSLSFTAQIQPDVVGPNLTANVPIAITLGAGQTERLTFNATAGTNVILNLSGVSTTPSGQSLTASVYEPDADVITLTDSYAQLSVTSSNTVTLSDLPVTGTYTVVVRPAYGLAGSGQLSFSTQ